jgi:hypothetical protein
MDTSEVIASKSLDFLYKLIDIDQQIIPVSALPYPKIDMEKNLLEHMADFIRDTDNTSETIFRLRFAYTTLAGCIDDADVKHIEKVEALLNKFDLDYDKKLPMSDEVKRAFISKGGQESDVARYIEILSEIGSERRKLATAFDLELSKANIAH